MKKNVSVKKEDRTLYQLWGCDSFSNEVYNCGVYRHRSSAYRAKHKHELEEAKNQDSELRDTFTIVPITESGYIMQRKQRQQEIEIKSDLRKVNQAFVNEQAHTISSNLQSLSTDADFEKELQAAVKNRCLIEEKKLVAVPTDLLIESIFVEVTREEGNNSCFSFYFGIRTKDLPYTSRCGATRCFLCSGTIIDFREQVAKSVSPEWVRTVLNRIIEKNIYETY